MTRKRKTGARKKRKLKELNRVLMTKEEDSETVRGGFFIESNYPQDNLAAKSKLNEKH